MTDIEIVLTNALRNKFKDYKPEPAAMPFHTRLLGKDRLALYSFIRLLNTNFGVSIFEPVASTLAKHRFKRVETQATAGKYISTYAFNEIQNIITELSTGRSNVNKIEHIERIREVCQKGEMTLVKPTKVDLLVESHSNDIYLIDIKTAKPNAGGFKEFKRTLLEWVACTLASNPTVQIHSLIAIPYNPYAPEPYSRWTMRGMLDLDQELKVAEEFWDFLGGENTYENLLATFEKVGITLKNEIDAYFARFV